MIKAHDAEFYNEQGYLLVKGVFNRQEVEAMRSGVEGILKRAIEQKRDGNHARQGDFVPAEEMKKLVLKGFHDVHYHDAAF